MVEIARVAGVSKSTVSLVLQDSDRVRTETRERVLETMRELGYVYNRGAASLRRRSSDMVGMVINDLTNPFFAELAVAIEDALQSSGMIPLLANTAEDVERQTRVMQVMREHGAAGYILSPALGTSHTDLEKAGIDSMPVICVMRRVPDADTAVVAPDNRAGARIATQHLIEHGHRRIAFLGGRAGMVVQEDRRDGYIDALSEAGLSVDPALIIEARPNRQGGAEALRKALQQSPPPTAAVCFNDVVALGAMHALNELGMTIGSEFALIGFDNVADSAEVSPKLTTIDVQTRELGARAGSMLLDYINDPALPPRQVLIPPRLIVRDSCGAHGN